MAHDLELGNGRFLHCYVTWLSTGQRSACSDTRALFKYTQSVDVTTVWTAILQTWGLSKVSKGYILEAFEHLWG